MTDIGFSDLQADVAVVIGQRELVWQSQAMPKILESNQLLCKTLYSVVSPGTEVAAYLGMEPLRDIPKFPRVVGYCNVAEIIEIGSSIEDVNIGDKIINFSSHRSYFTACKDDIVCNLGYELEPEKFASAYLFHLGLDAVIRGGVVLGSNVAVIGLGALGLTSCKMSKLAGANVVAVSNYDSSMEYGHIFGAKNVLKREEAQSLENSADVVIITTSTWQDWELGLKIAKQNGNISILGFPGRGQELPNFNPLSSKYLYTKQLKLINVGLPPEKNDSRGYTRFNQRDNMQFIVNAIRGEQICPKNLISGVYPFKELSQCYDALIERSTSPITFMLKW